MSDLAKNIDLRGLELSELEPIISAINEPKYRSQQIFEGLHRKFAQSPDEITTIKANTKEFLKNNFALTNITIDAVKESSDGTRKYRFKTNDGHIIESVFIPNAAKEGRHALCISSQVGCAMGCTFCATAKLKLLRNLTASEIVSQVYLVAKDVLSLPNPVFILNKNERPVHNIVFMGMGEPLHNSDNVIKAIKLLTDPRGMNFSPRRITVSTSGLVPKILELGEKTDVYLAISLNATTNEVRNVIMPVNNKWNIEELLGAAKSFPLKMRERITFEYVMLAGINDSEDDAHRLCDLMRGLKCKINLIPFNEHPLSPYKKPENHVVLMFHKILYRAGLSVFTRKTRGDDIDAACGMLGANALVKKRLEATT